MRWYRQIATFVALVAAASSSSVIYEAELGSSIEPIVQTFGENVVGCYLVNPQGETVELKPEDKSSDRFELKDDNLLSACGVKISEISATDQGNWTLFSVSDTENRKESFFTIQVNSEELEPEEPYEETVASLVYEAESGSHIEPILQTFGDTVVGCYLETPQGEKVEFKPEDKSSERFELKQDNLFSACGVKISEISDVDQGNWRLYSVCDGENIKEMLFAINVTKPTESEHEPGTEPEAQPETAPETEPETEPETQPETEPEAEPEADQSDEANDDQTSDVDQLWLNALRIDTNIGDTVEVKIPVTGFLETDSCHVITPDDIEHDLLDHNITGVEIIESGSISCGISIHVISEDLIGEWLLVANERVWGSSQQKRMQPFEVYVEEAVSAVPNEQTTVAAGSDFYIRLDSSTDNYESCLLVAPSGSPNRPEKDDRYLQSCGFVVKGVTTSDEGEWQIVYGDKIRYRAVVLLTVDGASRTQDNALELVQEKPFNQTLGPEDATYCRLVDPSGYAVYDTFGQCRMDLQRVSVQHEGTWKMIVGLPGKVLTEKHKLTVALKEADRKPTVTTTVNALKPSVDLLCSVSSPYEATACKFRDPSGRILLAREGVGEDRYSFSGNGTSYESGVYSHECGIRITDPQTSELGLWRCAIETKEEVYYGFLTALCPWAMTDPAVAAAIVTEPVLKHDREVVTSLEDESVTLGCSVPSAIEYCYFRASNGTVFSVGEGSSTSAWSYAGAGFDSGECAIRFSTLAVSDTGTWQCHVGLPDVAEQQQAEFTVNVQDDMFVHTYVASDFSLTVEGRAYDNHRLDYCRFVRFDGFGFKSQNAPAGYSVYGDLSLGICGLTVASPTTLDHHPWTVVARISGHNEEISGVTPHTIYWPMYYYPFSFSLFYSFVILLGVTLMLAGILTGTKKNRQWTYTRATRMGNSIRNSFRKKTLTTEDDSAKEGPPAYKACL